jgi:enediyne biosynthesis protein E7
LVLRPLETLMQAWRERGDVVRFRTGPYRTYLVVRPEHVRHVLTGHDYVRAHGHAAALRTASGSGLTGSEGELWRSQRRLLLPAFHRERIPVFEAAASRATERMLERWGAAERVGAPVDVHEAMLRLALETLTDGLFAVSLERSSATLVRDAAVVLERIYDAIRVPGPGGRAVLRWGPRARGARRRLYALCSALLDERGCEPGGDDLLSLLAREVPHRLACDQLVTMILAGHDTTGAALAWACHLVAVHPDVERRLHAESIRVGPAPSAYAAMVFHEALRMRPPAWLLSRTPATADVIDGCAIPRGATVLVSPFVTHHHPGCWPDPERFLPERCAGRTPGGYSYLPFGAGPRTCIGRVLAESIGVSVLTALARERRLVPVRPGDPRPRSRLTLHPDGPLWMRVCPR